MRKINDVMDILKSKKLRNNDKLSYLLQYYNNYFTKSFEKEVEEDTFATYAQECINGSVINIKKYDDYKKKCRENKLYSNFMKISKFIDTLSKSGIDINLLSSEEHKFLREVLDIKKDFKIDSSFDDLFFYYNSALRIKLVEKMESFVKKNFLNPQEKSL